MIRTTPFHERTSALNETGLWEHWSNHLAAVALPDVREVRVLRDPQQRRAVRLVAAVQVPDPRARTRSGSWPASSPATSGPASRATPSTRPGATTAASSSRTASSCGTRPDEFLLTAAEPNLAYFEGLVGRLDVAIEEVTDDWAVLVDPGAAVARRSSATLDAGRRGPAVLRPRRRRRSPRCRSRSRGPATPATSATRSGSRPATR